MAIEIGGRPCVLRRPVLQRHEAAFILGEPEREVRNRFRRGERLQAKGVSDEEIAARGALPVSPADGRRGVRPTILALHPRVQSNPMALEMLRSIVAGRFRAPKASASDKLPPAVDERLHRL